MCSRCLHDSALIAAIQQYGGPDECTYCESVPQSPHASAPLDFLTELVVEGLRYEYEDPIESIMVIKGEYQWPCIETLDLLDDLEIADDYRVHYALEQSISTEVWCPRYRYGESDASLTHSAWEKFVDLVKTRRRYTSHLHRPSGPHGIDEDNGRQSFRRSLSIFSKQTCLPHCPPIKNGGEGVSQKTVRNFPMLPIGATSNT